MSNSLKFIQFAVEQGVLQFGEFTLKSGRISPYFFNAGLFNDGKSIEQLSRFYAQAIVDSGVQFDMLFGPAYKGIPLATAVAMTLAREHKINVPYAFNRKEEKKYGDGGQIVGAALQGKILIVDDVITAGTAIKESIKIIEGAGASTAGVVIAFDRQEVPDNEEVSAVRHVEQKFGLTAIPVSTAAELVDYAESNNLYTEHLSQLKQYLKQYT